MGNKKQPNPPQAAVEAEVAKENIAAARQDMASKMPSAEVKLSFDQKMQNFTVNHLLPFHGELSVLAMDKKHSCAEYDIAVQKMAELNTILSGKIKAKMKAGTFGKDL